MTRTKKNKIQYTNIAPVIETGASVKITSIDENYYFGIYWLNKNQERIFKVEEFEKMKVLCIDFEERLKKGKLKIEY